jgi:hypothetical protein
VQKKGGAFFGIKAGMLLKTHVEKMSPFCLTIIFMKTKDLQDSYHYVIESNGG